MEFTFLLKKIVTMFIMPFPIFVLLLLLGFIFLHKNKLSQAKITLAISIIWLFLISYSPLVNSILYDYESKYPTLKTVPKGVEYIYVLGGGHQTDNALPITSQVNESSSVRLNEGIRLYQKLNKKPTLIVSGYSGLYDPTPHAFMQQKLAISLGVKPEKIHIHPKPKDTEEEARAAKIYMGNTPFILVTSASHMRRALKIFKDEGLNPIPAPTNHLATIRHPNYTGFFSISALRKSHIIWHEMLGLLWQKIKMI